MDYYDAVLGLIPVVLIFGTGFANIAGKLPLSTAIPIGAGAAIILVGHALFVNGPTSKTPTLRSKTNETTTTTTKSSGTKSSQTTENTN